MKVFDRVFCCLLILGGVGHSLGSFKAYSAHPDELLWSLCASLFIFLLGTVNLVRAGRHGDRTLGWITLVFNLCWLVASVQFGRVIGDLPPFSHPFITGVFSFRLMVVVGEGRGAMAPLPSRSVRNSLGVR